MISVIVERMNGIKDLCERFGVARLEVFGSAAEGNFDPQTSDIDLLIEYIPGRSLGPWMKEYFDLGAELEALLGRRVDLVMAGAAKNPFFAKEVNRTRTLLYAAKDPKVA